MKITKSVAKKTGDKLNIDFNVVDIDVYTYGMNVELEHGKVNKLTNVTNNDIIKTAKIALAHILEFPDYYIRLKKLETIADKYWSKKQKPQIIKK